MPFFTSTPKKPSPVFAGLDDPFNFPSAKMRYATRSSSRTSSPDSGYGSIDDEAQLSPKSSAAPRSRRRLKKDGKGHWRMHSYEYQSTDNDGVAERTPILEQDAMFSSGEKEGGTRRPDDGHVFVPNPRRTFTLMCDEGAQAKSKASEKAASVEKRKPGPKEKVNEKQGWFERRVYGRALQRRERSEGVSELQRQMAPVLRRASPAPERELVHRRPSASQQRPSAAQRKGSTLLHPSPPPDMPSSRPAAPRGSFGVKTTITGGDGGRKQGDQPSRGRSRKPSTLLHPSPPPSHAEHHPSDRDGEGNESQAVEALRSPRHRSKTPLRIPTCSLTQPAPTPLRIRIRRGPSVLHSCFSSDEDEDEDDNCDDDDGVSELQQTAKEGAGESEADASSVSSVESAGASAAGVHNEVILARTGMVARAQRVRVGRAGVKGVEVKNE
ncbi:hypothetical protein SVAN01_06969 [Stagonosporopsis vannaccii]|nr:hypothetical protein SVAN01_06969 [Stagonosporopsis vannaccii]